MPHSSSSWVGKKADVKSHHELHKVLVATVCALPSSYDILTLIGTHS